MTNLPPIPDVVWQQPQETSVNHHQLDDIHNDVAIKAIQTSQGLGKIQLFEVGSQIFPPKGIQHQKSATTSEDLRGNQTGNGQVMFLNSCNSWSTDL